MYWYLENSNLVTTGPYRWARNPWYASIYIIFISFFLVSAKWLIRLAWVTGYTVLLISRVPKEALMEQKLVEEIVLEAEHPGRFLPRIRKSDS